MGEQSHFCHIILLNISFPSENFTESQNTKSHWARWHQTRVILPPRTRVRTRIPRWPRPLRPTPSVLPVKIMQKKDGVHGWISSCLMGSNQVPHSHSLLVFPSTLPMKRHSLPPGRKPRWLGRGQWNLRCDDRGGN